MIFWITLIIWNLIELACFRNFFLPNWSKFNNELCLFEFEYNIKQLKFCEIDAHCLSFVHFIFYFKNDAAFFKKQVELLKKNFVIDFELKDVEITFFSFETIELNDQCFWKTSRDWQNSIDEIKTFESILFFQVLKINHFLMCLTLFLIILRRRYFVLTSTMTFSEKKKNRKSESLC